MKRIIRDTAGKRNSFYSILLMQGLRLGKIQFLLLLLIIFLTGCFRHYYKVQSKEVLDVALVDQLKADHKYFILHSEDKVMGTQQLNLVNGQLEAELVALPREHAHHTKPQLNAKNVMRSKQQSNTLMEVHLYSNTIIPSDQKQVTIPIGAINRIDIYEMDESATRQSHILSTVGLTAAGILIIGTLVLILTGGLVDLP